MAKENWRPGDEREHLNRTRRIPRQAILHGPLPGTVTDVTWMDAPADGGPHRRVLGVGLLLDCE